MKQGAIQRTGHEAKTRLPDGGFHLQLSPPHPLPFASTFERSLSGFSESSQFRVGTLCKCSPSVCPHLHSSGQTCPGVLTCAGSGLVEPALAPGVLIKKTEGAKIFQEVVSSLHTVSTSEMRVTVSVWSRLVISNHSHILTLNRCQYFLNLMTKEIYHFNRPHNHPLSS